MTPERWNYLKALRPATPRVVWESSRRGTYDIGRNAEKRLRRANAKANRAAQVYRVTPTNTRGPAAYRVPKESAK